MPGSRNSKNRSKHSSRNASLSSSSETLSPSLSSIGLSVSMPPPPDGGWGWMIVLAAFFINFIIDGIGFSFGVLYTELLSEFGESKSYTSWVGSLFYGMSLIFGPVASALATKYGCRKVTMMGGLVACVGFIASYFADSIGMLCFTFGIIVGFGMSMGYVTSVVFVAFYFEKRRALATGLAVCGTGIGTFVFAPLTEYLTSQYTWRGTMLIFAGISLNLVVCGALFRPLEFSPEQKTRRALLLFERMSASHASIPLTPLSRSRHASNSDELEDNNSDSDNNNSSESDSLEYLSYSQVELPTFLKNKKKLPPNVMKEIKENRGNLEQILHNYFMSMENMPSAELIIDPKDMLTITTSKSGEDHVVLVSEANGNCMSRSHKRDGKVCSDRPVKKRTVYFRTPEYVPLLRRDVFFRGNIFFRGNLTKLASMPKKSSSCPELYKSTFDDESSDEEETCFFWRILHFPKHVKKLLKIMFDPKIFKNPLFVLFAVSNFILYFWYDVPYVFIVDRIVEFGAEETEASFLISILGIANTLGQLLFGIMGDRAINLKLFYGLSIVLCGGSIMIVPLFISYVPISILSGAFGFFVSANYALSTVILVEILGLDKLSNAYGLTMMIQGIGNLGGPPFAGWLYDETESYDATFFMGGAFISLSGFLLCSVPAFKQLLQSCRSQKSCFARPATDDPSSGYMMKPSNGNLMNPSNGNLMNPSNGNLMNPSNGNLENPSSGNLMNPSNGNLMNGKYTTAEGQTRQSNSLEDIIHLESVL
ncbi:hypothetical protein CHS0354_041814 [Potamilus streckersoni]|uniref:Major facilitator superfamily (MFS) profile domain-containing protein n=1 Tax=Potamilus streckersoni TaxID=2493646 RepID=A0AAE0T159_9BIVA|nr:hypothetical protein CHS0354_041814 [Potamilus streckersoni]